MERYVIISHNLHNIHTFVPKTRTELNLYINKDNFMVLISTNETRKITLYKLRQIFFYLFIYFLYFVIIFFRVRQISCISIAYVRARTRVVPLRPRRRLQHAGAPCMNLTALTVCVNVCRILQDLSKRSGIYNVLKFFFIYYTAHASVGICYVPLHDFRVLRVLQVCLQLFI